MTTPQELGLPTVGDGTGLEPGSRLFEEELELALRNHALPLEGLRYELTPTGMHYTLVHYDIPMVDATAWRLVIDGHVGAPLTLSLEELRQRPGRTLRVTLECAGDGRALLQPRPLSQPWLSGAAGTADWTGTPLRSLLQEAGVGDGVVDVVFTGLDHGIEGGVEQDYQRSLPLSEALHEDTLLAWSMNGEPLQPQHGYPLRLIAPGWYGMAHVKWLHAITALAIPFTGYQQSIAYRYNQVRSEPGEAVTLMRVRSLMVPPGVPDFLTRTRIVRRGEVELRGRAWSGRSRITRVEVSTDGGTTWAAAEVEASPGPYCWQGWRYRWSAERPGASELCCRASDTAGNVQPVEQHWTARGMGNNAVQRVAVQVI
ncbi:MAG TPA: sulfite oxidase [Steroidobacteraceae bacterium]|nr:sulfite oxidase [Steroidobacteraceae bacterium]